MAETPQNFAVFSEAPQQDGDMIWQGSHKIQQGQSPAPVHGGDRLAGKQLCTGLRDGGITLNVALS